MPRKSFAALSTVVSIDAARSTRLRPPTSLSKLERETFVELASNAPHLKPTDAPLLATLAQATVMVRRLARSRDPTRIAGWERAARTQMALARSLRMTPQSRTDSRTAARRQDDVSLSAYEQMRIQNDAER